MTILIWVWFRVGNPNWTYSIDIFRWLFSLLTETRTRAFDFTQVRSKDDGLSNPVFKKYIIEKYNLTDLEKLLEKSGNTKELNTILIDVKNLNNFSRLEKELAVLYKKEKAASIVQPSNNVTKPKSFYERTLKPSLLPLKYTQYFATHESYTQRFSNRQKEKEVDFYFVRSVDGVLKDYGLLNKNKWDFESNRRQIKSRVKLWGRLAEYRRQDGIARPEDFLIKSNLNFFFDTYDFRNDPEYIRLRKRRFQLILRKIVRRANERELREIIAPWVKRRDLRLELIGRGWDKPFKFPIINVNQLTVLERQVFHVYESKASYNTAGLDRKGKIGFMSIYPEGWYEWRHELGLPVSKTKTQSTQTHWQRLKQIKGIVSEPTKLIENKPTNLVVSEAPKLVENKPRWVPPLQKDRLIDPNTLKRIKLISKPEC